MRLDVPGLTSIKYPNVGNAQTLCASLEYPNGSVRTKYLTFYKRVSTHFVSLLLSVFFLLLEQSSNHKLIELDANKQK